MTSKDKSLCVNIGGVLLDSPIVIASGVWPYEEELWSRERLKGVGALSTKAVTLEPRIGNPGTRVWETPSGMLNSIGLQNGGVDTFIKEYLPIVRKSGLPFVVNVAVERPAETEATLKRLNEIREIIPAVELNVSCPNVDDGGMCWGLFPESAAQAVSLARECWKGSLWVKLTPQSPDIMGVASAAEDAGADALVVANTWLGMAIDTRTARPVFERTCAGLSGPAIFPLALKAVWDVASTVNIPIVGCGGVISYQDCLAMIMAGASAVEIGTAMFIDFETPTRICNGLSDYLEEKGLSNLSELIGIAR